MITFVTDIRSAKEPDILAGFENYDLVLVPMDDDTEPDNLLRFSAPQDGWTHDELCRYSDMLACGDAYLAPPNSPMNVESAQWVGSSEI